MTKNLRVALNLHYLPSCKTHGVLIRRGKPSIKHGSLSLPALTRWPRFLVYICFIQRSEVRSDFFPSFSLFRSSRQSRALVDAAINPPAEAMCSSLHRHITPWRNKFFTVFECWVAGDGLEMDDICGHGRSYNFFQGAAECIYTRSAIFVSLCQTLFNIFK